jgi:MFS family permease
MVCACLPKGHFYPADIRGTGIGWATGIGRTGSLVAPVLGGIMLAENWSVSAICTTNAIISLLVVIIFIFQKFAPVTKACERGIISEYF